MLLLQKFSFLWNCESGYKIQTKINSNVPLLSVVGNIYLPMWAACFKLRSCPHGLVAHVTQQRLSYYSPEE